MRVQPKYRGDAEAGLNPRERATLAFAASALVARAHMRPPMARTQVQPAVAQRPATPAQQGRKPRALLCADTRTAVPLATIQSSCKHSVEDPSVPL
jgi:hypothetical protein